MADLSIITELLAVAVLYTGYPAFQPETLPVVRQLSPAQMIREICPEKPEECLGVVAQYDWQSPQIRLSTDLNLEEVQGQSFLLHELVHALQHRYRPIYGSDDCNLNLLGEREAYRVQNTFLALKGLEERHGGRLRYVRCPVDAKSTAVLQPADVYNSFVSDAPGLTMY
jgi:hypothetical protein